MINDRKFYNIKKFNLLDLKEPISRNEYIRFSNFEEKKYKKLLKILASKLNKFHNSSHDVEYWDKVLGYFLLFHITCCNRYFSSKLKNKNQLKGSMIRILSEKDFYTPINTSDYRNCFQHQNFGQEQMFSHFLRFFLKNKRFINFREKFLNKEEKIINSNKNKINPKYLFYRIFNFFFRNIYRNKVNFLATGCYWKQELKYKIQFFYRGNFLCRDFYIPKIQKTFSSKNIIRDKIFSLNGLNNKIDNFDKFFFSTLKYCMPKSFIEEFAYKSSFAESFINKNNNLRYIINENLSEDNMFLIAHAQLHNIKTIYCEHNYLQHHFIGNLIKFITNKFDFFLTLGWKSKNRKLKSAGSLFFLGKEKRKENKIQYPILFADGVTAHRAPFTSSAYGESGNFRSLNYVKMNIVFFNTLKKFILKKIWVKEYPEKFKSSFCYNPINKEIYKSKIFFTNKLKDSNSNLDECIASAGLIVTNYLSTSYIQALMSNKPTIIFFNSKSYFLNEKYQNFYKELIKSKIMHSNPEHAATFINNNFNNLDNWWFDPLTQKARRNFINNNIKDQHNMQNVLNEILKKH